LFRFTKRRKPITQAEIARIARARVTQILNLTNLASNIQQAILDLEPTTERAPCFRQCEIRQIATASNWSMQRKAWKRLANLRSRKPTAERQSRAKYRVRFSDGLKTPMHHDQLVGLSEFKINQIRESDSPLMNAGLYGRVIYRWLIGLRAYGRDDEASNADRRGIYLPPAELHWSLYGVREQLENDETQKSIRSFRNSSCLL